jgi:hypothetical protein
MSSLRNAATDAVKNEVVRRTGWFRPFLLALLVLLLVNTCVVGGAIVLLLRQVITLPPGLISALTGGPAPVTVNTTTVLDRIEALSELMTTRFNYSSLVTSERDMPEILRGLYGDRMVMVAVGHVNAGIDVKNIRVTEGPANTLVVTLPPPILQDCFLDEKKSYVVSRDTGFFAKPAPNMDQEARRYAVEQFRDMAIKAEIYQEAQQRAKNLIENLLIDIGVKKVNVVTSPIDPNAPFPASCQ